MLTGPPENGSKIYIFCLEHSGSITLGRIADEKPDPFALNFPSFEQRIPVIFMNFFVYYEPNSPFISFLVPPLKITKQNTINF